MLKMSPVPVPEIGAIDIPGGCCAKGVMITLACAVALVAGNVIVMVPEGKPVPLAGAV